MVNGAGPFDFMVDTGSQLNVVDPSLAADLKLKSRTRVGLVATASVQQASADFLDSLQVGPQVILRPIAAIQDFRAIQAADSRIRRVLGDNFLAHFDLLIEYPRRLLCLDHGNVMEKDIRGQQIPFVLSRHPEGDIPFSDRLVISAVLSELGTRPVLLQIDSGSDGAILFAGSKALDSLLRRAELQGLEQGGTRRAFVPLPPQDLRIGSQTLRCIQFVTPTGAALKAANREEEGVLATVPFQRVYISHSNHFITLDQK